MDEFRVLLFTEFVIGILGIIFFRIQFYSKPPKSILPVILGFIILTLCPGIGFYINQDGFGIFGTLAAAGFTMIVYWVYLLIEIIVRFVKSKDSDKFAVDFANISLLLLALLIIFLVLKSHPIGKIGG